MDMGATKRKYSGSSTSMRSAKHLRSEAAPPTQATTTDQLEGPTAAAAGEAAIYGGPSYGNDDDADNANNNNSSNSNSNSNSNNLVDAEAARMLPLARAQTDSPEWQATIEKVVKCVVSIHFCQTVSFDTDLSFSSQATGFVVDAKNGYILTNRHVVCAGPFWGYCIFDNHEEVRS